METPNIQLYNFLRYDFHLTDIKSLEFMHILDNEYKSGLKDDFKALENKTGEGFQAHGKQLDDLKEGFGAFRSDMRTEFGAFRSGMKAEFSEFRSDMKAEFGEFRGGMKAEFGEFRSEMKAEFSRFRSDTRVEFSETRGDLRVEIRESKIETIRWVISFFFALALMILAIYLKK